MQLTTKCNLLAILTSICWPISIYIFTSMFTFSYISLCPMWLNSPQQKMSLKELNTQKHSKLVRTLCTTIKILLHGKKRFLRNQNYMLMQKHDTENIKMLLVTVQFISLNVIEPYWKVQHLVDVTWCLLTELFFLMRQNMLLRIRAHIIRSFCSCKCMWRWCKTTGSRMYRESGKKEKNWEVEASHRIIEFYHRHKACLWSKTVFLLRRNIYQHV